MWQFFLHDVNAFGITVICLAVLNNMANDTAIIYFSLPFLLTKLIKYIRERNIMMIAHDLLAHFVPPHWSQVSSNAHRKKQARDISEKNVKRSQQIVSQKQSAIGKERNFTSQENRKREKINTSNLAPMQEPRDPFSAQKVKPLYQL